MVKNNCDFLYSKGKNDELVTPDYGIIPLIKYLPKDKIIWCPFDKEDSGYVRILKKHGFNVVFSHIDSGKDFYNYEPSNWDIMVSNPPFTKKRLIFERALEFNKPFALLMTNVWLNDSAPKHLFKDKDLQLLMFDKRIEYNDKKRIPFSSSYYCYNLLPKQIVMEYLNKKLKKLNSGNGIIYIDDINELVRKQAKKEK